MRKNMLRISNNPTLQGLSSLCPGIVYSTATGTQLRLDLLTPFMDENGNDQNSYPLVVFIQGSAWQFPDTDYQLPQLSWISQAGYVVASVTHRSIQDGHPAPAFLKDVKTAIRFLRTNAARYHIDPERVYAFGTSSGGNTSLLLGLTGDREEFRTQEYPDVSDHVDAVIDCFGPTLLSDYLQLPPDDEMGKYAHEAFSLFCGGKIDDALLTAMSPISYVQKGRDYVPFLIAHGDQDQLVDFSHSARMVKRLEECGADVSFVCVEGAEHEGTFWSRQIWDIFLNFLNKQAGK